LYWSRWLAYPRDELIGRAHLSLAPEHVGLSLRGSIFLSFAFAFAFVLVFVFVFVFIFFVLELLLCVVFLFGDLRRRSVGTRAKAEKVERRHRRVGHFGKLVEEKVVRALSTHAISNHVASKKGGSSTFA
jgi:polyferredoxin